MKVTPNGLTQDWRLAGNSAAASFAEFCIIATITNPFIREGTFIDTTLRMKSFLFLLGLAATSVNAAAQPKPIPAYKATALMQRLSNPDTTYIVNFWATWCVPCIQEMPEFEILEKRFAGTSVKVLLVSLDFKEDLRFRVPAFIERKRGMAEVVWLAETDA